MLQKKFTTLQLKLRSPTGKLVDGAVIVRDGFALATFNDPFLAKQLYDESSAEGKEVSFNEKNNAFIQKYEGLKKSEIILLLKKELKKAGGELIG